MMGLEPAQIASILVSLIAASAAYASGRASAKASMTNASGSNRVEMEKEAYERARALDTETIRRQDDEIDELRGQLKSLNDDVKMVNQENEQLHEENRRVIRVNEEVLADNDRLIRVNEEVLADNGRLREEVAALRQRFTRFERGLHPDSTEHIRERKTDTDPMMKEVNDGRE